MQNYRSYLLRLGLRQETIAAHIQRLKQVERETALNHDDFENWLLEKLDSGIKKSSLNRHIITIRSYCKFKNWDWGKKLKLFKEEPTHKAIFSDEEIEEFLSLEKPPYFRADKWYQWTVFFSVLAFSGMRASEVAQLRVEQVDFGSNNFILDHTKTTPRRVPISAVLLPLMHKYISLRNKYLFPSPYKRGHIWRGGWNKHFHIRLDLLGIKRSNLTTHSFRHSFITNLWEENTPLPDIMHIVGHKKAETTLKYSHLGNKSAQRAINNHSIARKSLTPHEQLKSFLDDVKKRGMLDDERFEYIIQSNFIAIWEKGKKPGKIEFQADIDN